MSTKCFIKDNAGITPLTVLLIIFVLAAIISCFWYIASTREITCTPEDQVKLTGVDQKGMDLTSSDYKNARKCQLKEYSSKNIKLLSKKEIKKLLFDPQNMKQ